MASAAPPVRCYRFGDFRLDISERRLTRDGTENKLLAFGGDNAGQNVRNGVGQGCSFHVTKANGFRPDSTGRAAGAVSDLLYTTYSKEGLWLHFQR